MNSFSLRQWAGPIKCVVLTMLVLCESWSPKPCMSQGTTRVIAATGDAPPDGNGAFASLDVPLLNNAGQVAFRAAMSGTTGGPNDNVGIYRSDGATLTQIEREFFVSLGGSTLTNLSDTRGFNDAGQVLYTATIDSQLISPTAQIRRGDGGTPTVIVAQGDPAPSGIGGFNGTVTNSFLVHQPAINNAGQVSFDAGITGTSGGSTDNYGVFRGGGSGLTQIVRKRQPAPDGDGTFSFNQSSDATTINDSGQVMLATTFEGTANQFGIVKGSGGSLTQIVRTGQPVPSGDGWFFAGFEPSLNNSGQVAFRGFIGSTPGGTSNDHGVFRADGTDLVQIVRRGQTVPDGNGVFDALDNTLLNDAGQVLFSGSLAETSGGFADDAGVFRGNGMASGLGQVARAGQPSPDGDGTLSNFLSLGLNSLGQAVFKAVLSNTPNDSGIFVADGIDIVQVARVNQRFDGVDVSSLSLADGSGPGGNMRRSLNDAGQVAYQAHLDDGSDVIALWTPPEVYWKGGSGLWTTTSNWQAGVTPKSLFDVFLAPAGGATIEDGGGNEYVKSLTVGNDAGALVVLNQDSNDLTSLRLATIRDRGRINLGNGRTFSATTITNLGVLAGDGRIAGRLVNQSSGELRVASGESLVLTGTGSTNAGRIEVVGGAIEFVDGLTNRIDTGAITASRATLRFGSGLVNDGSLGVTFGESFVFGDVENTGQISLSGNAGATFFDDVVNDGSLNVSNGSTAVFFGAFTGANGTTGGGTVFLEGDLRPGHSPAAISFGSDVVFGALSTTQIELGGTTAGSEYDRVNVLGTASLGGALELSYLNGFSASPGDTFRVVEAGELIGMFDSIALPDAQPWVVNYDTVGGTLTLSVALAGDIDLDGDVDRIDAALFAQYYGTATGGTWITGDFDFDGATTTVDLALLQSHFGHVASPSPSLYATSVPEPTALAIVLVAAAMFAVRTRRQFRCFARFPERLSAERCHRRRRVDGRQRRWSMVWMAAIWIMASLLARSSSSSLLSRR